MDIVFLQSAEPASDWVLHLTFDNAVEADLDFSTYPPRAGLFAKLDDRAYFRTAQVTDGALTWGDGELDIAPESLYSRATGEPLPAWLDDAPQSGMV